MSVNDKLTLEVVGYMGSECSPFPCDENRTCGFVACAPSGELIKAFDALKDMTDKEFGGSVELKLTLLDEGVPEYIKTIYEREHPAIPMILINNEVIPVGRISWPQIKDAILTRMNSQSIS